MPPVDSASADGKPPNKKQQARESLPKCSGSLPVARVRVGGNNLPLLPQPLKYPEPEVLRDPIAAIAKGNDKSITNLTQDKLEAAMYEQQCVRKRELTTPMNTTINADQAPTPMDGRRNLGLHVRGSNH